MDLSENDADGTAKETQLLESWKAYKRNFQEGVAIFNAKPKKGIAFMQVRRVAAHLSCLLQWAQHAEAR